MEAIILAGGFGTRLRSIISDIPKPMAPIHSKPFLEYILDYLQKHGIRKVILSTGYKHSIIESYFGSQYKGMQILYSVEIEPLGTGGAIKKAMNLIEEDNFLILNGDTYFNVNIKELKKIHFQNNADITLSLFLKGHSNRYGIVETEGNKVINFNSINSTQPANINGGVYLVKKNLFDGVILMDKFSFENDFLARFVDNLRIYGYFSQNYFVDIGIPEDYLIAQKELPINYEK